MRKILFPIFLLMVLVAGAQTGLRVTPGVRLSGDSLELMGGLNGWLAAQGGPDSLNGYVAERDRPAMVVLMDQLRNVRGTCYVGNVITLDSGRWQVQLNYVSMQHDTPALQACCTVLARREGGRVYFSSPLEKQTAGWKTRTIGCCTFHYQTEINIARAAEFERTLGSYDKRLAVVKPAVDFYCCGDFGEVEKLVGLDYMQAYSGIGYNDFWRHYGKRMVIVCGNPWKDGFCTISMHDIWHTELRRVVSAKIINRPVDEGMAYLYGGSWIKYSWKDILKMVEDYRAAHPGADWLSLYKEGTNLMPPPEIIKISYAINALIVQRLEKEKGFAASLPLVCCGVKEAGDGNYFAALEKTVGVNQAGFNAYIEGLLKDAL